MTPLFDTYTIDTIKNILKQDIKRERDGKELTNLESDIFISQPTNIV